MMTSKYHQREYLIVAIVLLVFAVLYGLLSLVNHACFRTSCLDLGVYTNALYDYAHFHANDSSTFLPHRQNLLRDHFDLYLIIFSPLVWIFGQWTLLIVQILFVLFGGVGFYLFVRDRISTENNNSEYPAPIGSIAYYMPLLAMVCYLAFFGTWHALSFDYHSNVVAASCFPWLLLAIRRCSLKWASVLFVFIIVAKETMPIWLCFILLALVFDHWRNRRMLLWMGCAALFAVAYFIVVALWIMPSMGNINPGWWRYAHMGANAGEMVRYMISNPLQVVQDFCSSTVGGAEAPEVKRELVKCLLLSGGALLLFKPNYLIMLVPLLMQKFLSVDTAFWGIGYQYNAEIGAVVVAGAFCVLTRLRIPYVRLALSLLVVALTLRTTYKTTQEPKAWIWRERTDILSADHYHQSAFSTDDANRLIRSLPKNASVCATSHLVPHLALRNNIYLWPQCSNYDYEYLLLALDSPEAQAYATELKQDPEWQIIEQPDGLLLARHTQVSTSK